MTRRATPQPGVDRMVSTSWSGRRWSSPAARQGRALARGLEGRLPLQHHYVRDQNSSSSRCRAYFSLALKHGIYREPRSRVRIAGRTPRGCGHGATARPRRPQSPLAKPTGFTSPSTLAGDGTIRQVVDRYDGCATPSVKTAISFDVGPGADAFSGVWQCFRYAFSTNSRACLVSARTSRCIAMASAV
jgi:hypothetical protein